MTLSKENLIIIRLARRDNLLIVWVPNGINLVNPKLKETHFTTSSGNILRSLQANLSNLNFRSSID